MLVFFTAGQLVAHLVGDYIFQTHWMAVRKTESSFAAFVHAFTYLSAFSALNDVMGGIIGHLCNPFRH